MRASLKTFAGLFISSLLFATTVFAQGASSSPPSAISITGGLSFRGDGRAGAASPFPMNRGSKVFWLGGGYSRDVRPRLAVDADLTWTGEPEYTASGVGAQAVNPIGRYGATNRLNSFAAAGLTRFRAWRGFDEALDVIGGFGWVIERRSSDLVSISGRALPNLPPPTRASITDVRHVPALITGFDLLMIQGDFALVLNGRLQFNLTGDDDRSDLDLARQSVRIGAGARFRF